MSVAFFATSFVIVITPGTGARCAVACQRGGVLGLEVGRRRVFAANMPERVLSKLGLPGSLRRTFAVSLVALSAKLAFSRI